MKPRTVQVWRVTAGEHRRVFYTHYHAEQYADALRRHKPLAGVPVTVDAFRVPNDPLTALTVA